MAFHAPAKPWLTAGAALMAAASLGACHKEQKLADTIPPVVSDTVVPGAMTTTVPARTGSQASGTEGSSTVIGAPPKGQAGIALAH